MHVYSCGWRTFPVGIGAALSQHSSLNCFIPWKKVEWESCMCVIICEHAKQWTWWCNMYLVRMYSKFIKLKKCLLRSWAHFTYELMVLDQTRSLTRVALIHSATASRYRYAFAHRLLCILQVIMRLIPIDDSYCEISNRFPSCDSLQFWSKITWWLFHVCLSLF